jgi:hypothetical protein
VFGDTIRVISPVTGCRKRTLGVHRKNGSKGAKAEELCHPSKADANQPMVVQIAAHRATDNTSASISEARLVSRRAAKLADSSRRVVSS